MVQLLYKYDRCRECGHEGFQWGVEITITYYTTDAKGRSEQQNEHVFFCYGCIKTIGEKLDDMIEESKHKAVLKL